MAQSKPFEVSEPQLPQTFDSFRSPQAGSNPTTNGQLWQANLSHPFEYHTMVTNPIILGQNSMLASPAFDDLYLPVFGGEVLTRYNQYLTASKFVRRKNITSGNTAKFPRLGGIGAERHARGQRLLGLDSAQTELSITLDERPLVSHFRVDDIDEMLLHFDARSERVQQTAQALAEAQDSYTLRLLINASRKTRSDMFGGSASTEFLGGGMNGEGLALTSSAFPSTVVTDENLDPETWAETAVTAILLALDRIKVRWARLRIPFQGRHCILPVAAWEKMRSYLMPHTQATPASAVAMPMFQATDGSYGMQSGAAQGNVMSVTIPDFNVPLVYNGFMIWQSNLLPNGLNIVTDEAKYRGDFTDTRGIVFQQEAVGIVVKMDITNEAGRDIEVQDFLFLSKMLSGGGALRPECAVELKYAA